MRLLVIQKSYSDKTQFLLISFETDHFFFRRTGETKMRLLLVLTVSLAILAGSAFAKSPENIDSSLLAKWQQFMKQHGKVYKSAEEEALR